MKNACLAALYRLTKDEKRFEELKGGLDKEKVWGRYTIVHYLQQRVATESARKCAADFDKQLKEEREKEK